MKGKVKAREYYISQPSPRSFEREVESNEAKK